MGFGRCASMRACGLPAGRVRCAGRHRGLQQRQPVGVCGQLPQLELLLPLPLQCSQARAAGFKVTNTCIS